MIKFGLSEKATKFTYFINIFFSIIDYAYITDEAPGEPGTGNCNNRHSLSTFVNVSNAPTPPFSMIVTSNTLQPLSNNEPEPYATTDILRAEKEKLQQNHYAVNIYAFLLPLIKYSWALGTFTKVCLFKI